MLNMLKNLIKERKTYLEAADLLLEDEELDDSIVLGEEGDEDIPEESSDDGGSDFSMDEGGDDEEDMLNDTLPEPVGAQTGEPAQVGDDDILGATIDLATNTQTDVLPIPPANATDAIDGSDDDIMNTKVDDTYNDDDSEDLSDFPDEDGDKPDEDKEDDIMSTPIKDDSEGEDKKDDDESDNKDDADKEESSDEFDMMSEAISIGGDAGAAPPADTQADPNAVAPDVAPDTGAGQDNAVTAAVKDKVGEVAAEPTVDDTGEVPTEEQPADVEASKNDLLKKLSSLTKNIEDMKTSIINKLS